ncbi:coiled-coil domain-containing protein 142 isoform X2 [Microcaecilia unicolor]|uniref:Coiled-coil domain-containing protein 142 isoform X2 n=1 Tax=Microcaecilia unicolor TaxID=1415580 RepID=A0A6P7WUB9_9AMPH|nr:coiled-coil domain-containing protein 142 isoform X2 [Microcaecilia unicolor]
MAWMSPSGKFVPPAKLLVAQKKVVPVDTGQEESEEAPASGSASPVNVRKPFLRNRLNPCFKGHMYPRSDGICCDSKEDEEMACLIPEVHQNLSSGTTFEQVERSLLAFSSCLSVQRNLITETLQAHVKPVSVDSPYGEFYHHFAFANIGQCCARLHALIWQRHHLMLAREYTRRLKSASDFIQKLTGLLASDIHILAMQQHSAGSNSSTACSPWQLKVLCEKLQIHTRHWRILQRTIRRDRWLRPLYIRKPCAVLHMKRTFALLSDQAIYLIERYIDKLLCYLVHANVTDVSTDLVSDIFQGIEIYNRVMSELKDQMKSEPTSSISSWVALGQEEAPRSVDNRARAYPISQLLKIIPGMRGQLTAEGFYRFLLQREPLISSVRQSCLDGVPWDKVKVHLMQSNLFSKSRATGKRNRLSRPKLGEPRQMLTSPSPSDQLQAICTEDEQLVNTIVDVLVSMPYSLWHQALNKPKPDRPCTEVHHLITSQEASEGEASGDLNGPYLGWVSTDQPGDSDATRMLCAQLRSEQWKAFGTCLFDQFYCPLNSTSALGSLSYYREGVSWAVVQMLEETLGKAYVPEECEAELKNLCVCLLAQAAIISWDREFCSALGCGVNDKCVPETGKTDGVVRSRTAGLFLGVFQSLEFLLQCLDLPWICNVNTTCSWVMTKAYQYLSSWSLKQFLLVTQADLMLLCAEIEKLMVLVKTLFPDDTAHVTSLQETQLCLQIHAAASNIKHFSETILQMFIIDCRKMSTDFFQQNMPVGKHWQARFSSAEDVSNPSEYAVDAAHSVIGQVLKGILPLTQEAQITVLAQVVTAFLETWMDRILHHKIKFSLQGALQLKNDFDLVRDMIQSQDSGLSVDTRQAVLSLRVFHQVDNAIICLLQQPPSKKYMPSPVWKPFRICCSQSREFNSGSLNSLESLEVQASRHEASLEAHTSATADLLSKIRSSSNPECYLTMNQQEWLSLRLHSGRRWKGPNLSCMNRTPET